MLLFKVFAEEILAMKIAGYTKREIEERYKFAVEQIKEFLKRHRRKEGKLTVGIVPRPKENPGKDEPPRDVITEQAYESEGLRMQNKLLWDSLQSVGNEATSKISHHLLS